MLFLKKYILLVFLLENIMAQTFLFGSMSSTLFYPFMAVGAWIILSPSFWYREKIKKYGALFALMGLYVVYEFIIGFDYLNSKTLLYLIAKLSTFGIIIGSIDSNENFYRGKAVWILSLFMAFMLCYGLLSGGGVRATGRALAGFTNENTAGSMGALTVGFVIFYMKNRKWNFLATILVLLGFYGILAGASRAGFLMLGVLVFLRYGFSFKTITFALLLVIVGVFVLPEAGVHTVGLQRMINTYNGVEGTNRDLEREAAEWMIAQRPWIGWGFAVKNQGYAAHLSLLGSHNGYLEITKQMGYPMAVIYFGIICVTIARTLSLKRMNSRSIDLFFALTIMLLIAANYEGLFVGVHEYETNLFFFAFAMVSVNNYRNYLSKN